VDDQSLIDQINEMAHEEHQLFERAGHEELSAAEHERLKKLGVELDQCWDLLHQRRARRSAGLDPDEAQVRDAGTVEGYVN
jgi:hypothetical protein